MSDDEDDRSTGGVGDSREERGDDASWFTDEDERLMARAIDELNRERAARKRGMSAEAAPSSGHEVQLDLFGLAADCAETPADLLSQVDEALEAQDLQTARRLLEDGIEGARGGLASLLMRLANLHLAEGRGKQARRALQEATRVAPSDPRTHLGRGLLASKEGMVREARMALQRVIALDPHCGPAYYHLARLLMENDNPRSAESLIERGLEGAPDHAPLHLLRGRLRASQDRPDEARRSLRRAVELDPDLAQAWYQLGGLEEASGDADAARSAFENAARLAPGESQLFVRLGVIYARRGEVDQAVAAFEKAVALDPDAEEAWYNLGVALRSAERFEEAAAAFQRAIDDPDELPRPATAWCLLARCRVDLGDFEAAIMALREAVALDPIEDEAANSLAALLASAGDREGAAQVLVDLAQALTGVGNTQAAWATLAEAQEMAGDQPGFDHDKVIEIFLALNNLDGAERALEVQAAKTREASVNWYRLGESARAKGDAARAERAYRNAIAIDPDYASPHVNLGILHQERGDLEAAVVAWRRAWALDQSSPEAASNLGLALVRLERLDEAEPLLREVTDRWPRFEAGWINLGELFMENGNWEGALESMRQAKLIVPSSAQIWVYLGFAHLERDEYASAETAMKKAVELDPTHAYAWNALGCILLKKDDIPAAIEAFENALRWKPDFEEPKEQLEELWWRRDGRAADETRVIRENEKRGDLETVVELGFPTESITISRERGEKERDRYWVAFPVGAIPNADLEPEDKGLFSSGWESGPLASLAAALEHAMPRGSWILAEPRAVLPDLAARLGSFFDDAWVEREAAGLSLPTEETRAAWRRIGPDEPETTYVMAVSDSSGIAFLLPAYPPRTIAEAVEHLRQNLDRETLVGLRERGPERREPIELVKAKLGLWNQGHPLLACGESPDAVARLALAALRRSLGKPA